MDPIRYISQFLGKTKAKPAFRIRIRRWAADHWITVAGVCNTQPFSYSISSPVGAEGVGRLFSGGHRHNTSPSFGRSKNLTEIHSVDTISFGPLGINCAEMSDGALFCLALIVVLASVIYLYFPSEYRASTSKPVNTPLRSVSPLADDKKFEATIIPTSAYKSPIPTDIPTPPPSPRGRRKPSITALITNILPLRRGSLASPATSAVGAGEQPVIDRSGKEIEAYGDFPDYAMLSGVRLPDSYPEFNIETALARPYRPFRWSYHQTMGMLSTVALPGSPTTCLERSPLKFNLSRAVLMMSRSILEDGA